MLCGKIKFKKGECAYTMTLVHFKDVGFFFAMWLCASYLTLASIRESIVNSEKAGLLTYNIFTILPIPIAIGTVDL